MYQLVTSVTGIKILQYMVSVCLQFYQTASSNQFKSGVLWTPWTYNINQQLNNEGVQL